MVSNQTILFGRKLKYNEYAQYADRISSFETWPQQMCQDKYALAKAGFIYTKEGDIVECFACGVRVSQWKTIGIPDTEHKKWSPQCIYLKLTGCQETNTKILIAEYFLLYLTMCEWKK